MAERTVIEAINLEDVGVDGGIFRVTEGLLAQYGEERVIDSPLAESAILGVGMGMAIDGLRPICEIQFSGFAYLGFHQIESHIARMRWRSQGRFTVPMVVRMPYGGGVRALEHHSESREVYYAHTPGLKMVIPSGPRNARALLLAAIRDERRSGSRYASIQRCEDDVRLAEGLFERYQIPYVDTTEISIEEIATKIMLITGMKTHLR